MLLIFFYKYFLLYSFQKGDCSVFELNMFHVYNSVYTADGTATNN